MSGAKKELKVLTKSSQPALTLTLRSAAPPHICSVTDRVAAKINKEAVKAVNADLKRRKMIGPGCLKDFNFVAVQACFEVSAEGGGGRRDQMEGRAPCRCSIAIPHRPR